LIQAQQALAALQVQRSLPITAADRQAVARGLALASELTGTNLIASGSVPLPARNGDQGSVTLGNLKVAQFLVGAAIETLRKRQDLLETNSEVPVSLAPSERGLVEKRLAQIAQTEGVYCFSSKMVDLLLLLMACGAIGGATQSMSSIVNFFGSDRFKPKWGPFYVVRPLIGGMLAVGLYFLLAAGFLSVEVSPGPAPTPAVRVMATTPSEFNTNAVAAALLEASPAGQITQSEYAPLSGPSVSRGLLVCCALAILIGLFSGEAMERFKDVAAAVFKTNKGKDAIEDKHPTVVGHKVEGDEGLTPDSITDLSPLATEIQKRASQRA